MTNEVTINGFQPGDSVFLLIGTVSHGAKITRTVLHDDNRVSYSMIFGGTDLEVHGVPSSFVHPLTPD